MEMKLVKIDRQALDEIALDVLPANYREKIRVLDTEGPQVDCIVPSFTDSHREYKVTVLQNSEGGWFGWCTCRGMASKKGAEGAVKPCRHIAAAIYAQEGIDIQPIPDTAVKAEKYVFWPSSIGRVIACPASASKKSDLLIDQVGDPAKVGQAVHAALALLVEGKEIPSATRLAMDHGLDEVKHGSEIESLISAGRWAWFGTKDHPGFITSLFHKPAAEVRLEYSVKTKNPHTGEDAVVEFHGRADVYEEKEEEAAIIDWKTGYKTDEDAHMPQMISMAVMAFARNRHISKVTAVLVWLRDWQFSAATFTREGVRDWLRNFLRRKAFWDGKTYNPGSHCRYCPRSYECPARAQMMRTAITEFVGKDTEVTFDENGVLRPAADIFKLYEAAKTVNSEANKVLSLLKDAIDQTGPVVYDGRKLEVAQSSPPIQVEFGPGEEYLRQQLGDNLKDVLSVSTSKLKKVVMAEAPKGEKTAAWQSFLLDLKKVDAVKLGTPRKTLKISKIKEEDQNG